MEIFVIITLIINLLILFSLIIFKKRIKENIEKELNEYEQIHKNNIDKKLREEYEQIKDNHKKESDRLYDELEEKKKIYDSILEEKEEIIKKEEEKKNLILNQKKENIDKELEIYKNLELSKIDIENETLKDIVESLFESKLQEMVDEYLQYEQINIEQREELDQNLEKVKEELEDYRKRREVINEAIRREEEAQNQIDYHRIILSEIDKEDIYFLLSIEDKIHNKELLHKLIWSEYLQKPFNQMLNNIFGSKIPKNVIYCIENFTTHKKYIGKTSAEVSKRWTEHIKSSLNIGGIKKQKIHDALFKHWDEYTFSILEETTKENLSEKEKYWINFFETDKYGFNSKSGG